MIPEEIRVLKHLNVAQDADETVDIQKEITQIAAVNDAVTISSILS